MRCLLSVAIAGALCAPTGARSEVLIAVLVEVEGDVSIAEAAPPGRGEPGLAPVRRARYLQALKMGDEVHLPLGAQAGLVCSTDRWIALAGGRDQPLTQQLCRAGRPLPPGTYRRLAPAAGRLRYPGLAAVLEGETRRPEDDDFAIPLLVSPRQTAVLDGRPEIRWRPIPEAVEYEIELTGRNPFQLRLDAAQVPCNERWGDLVLCALPYPGREKELPAEEVSFLSVGARSEFLGVLRKESKPNRVRRLPTAQAAGVRAELARLEELPLGSASRELLAADLYVRQGLMGEAIAAYQRSLALRDAPEVRVTLADLYLMVGLLRLAAHGYQRARDESSDGAVAAGAELGLGRVEQIRCNRSAALAHFWQARDRYVALGLQEERARVEKAIRKLEQAARRRQ